MVKKLFIPIFFICVSCLKENEKKYQNTDTFIRLLNGGYEDLAQDFCQTKDGEIVVLATVQIEKDDTIRYKIKLIKLNRYGHMQWEKIYPAYNALSKDSISYKGHFLMVNKDQSGNESGYLIVGKGIHHKKGAEPTSGIKMIVTDTEGNMQKSLEIDRLKEYGSLKGIAATTNNGGNYIVLGSVENPTTAKNVFLAELDKELNIAWEQAYNYGTSNSVLIVNRIFNDESSSSLVWAGNLLKNNVQTPQIVKIPLNSQSPIFDLPIGYNQTINSFSKYGFGFAFIGSTGAANNSDILVKHISQKGKEIFSDTYGRSNLFEEGLAITDTDDGGLILLGAIAGVSGTTQAVKNAYLIKIDPFGKVQWERIIKSKNDLLGVRILEATNGFLILGNTSFGGLNTISLIKTDKNGYINAP